MRFFRHGGELRRKGRAALGGSGPRRDTIRITFVRHGATDWNRDRRFQGQVDIPLNAEGKAQAQALADALRDETFDYAASSDLSRAYETALAIRNGAPVHRDARWREFAFGEWEGLTWEQIVRRHPQLADSERTLTERYVPPGGETFEAVCERVGRALAEYESQPYGNVLIVTHAGPLHAMLHAYFGDRATKMQEALGVRFSPAGITRVEVIDGRPELLLLNDVSHVIRAEWE